jgi:two-component system, NtrC family, response regulator AtoC
MKQILVVDDEAGPRESLKAIFWNTYRVLTAESASEALKLLKASPVDLVLLDILMPGRDGIDFLQEIRTIYPDLPVIMVSAVTSTNTMAEAIRLGAVDFVSKPFDVADIRIIAERALTAASMRRELEAYRRENMMEYPVQNVVGDSPAFRVVLHQARSMAEDESAPIMLVGERGVGNELLARFIHSIGPRSHHPFISLQCSSLPEEMIEIELFGQNQNDSGRTEVKSVGRIEIASFGTLLLRDVQTIPQKVQQQLLEVIKEGVFRRVSSSQPIRTQVRLIFTFTVGTSFPPQGILPELNAVLEKRTLKIPSLRDRTADVPVLAYSFLHYFRQRMSLRMADIEIQAMDLMRKYSWPGNVKELRTVIERAAVVHGAESSLRAEHLPYEIQALQKPLLEAQMNSSLEDAVNALQREMIMQALSQTKGRQIEAAKLLGTTTRILGYRMKQLQIEPY